MDVIVIGGGAAGLFCARTAGLRGRRVLVLERNPRLGNKILISGGGRCNFTNVGATAANYVTRGSPHFVKSALARYTPQDFLSLVERHGIAWHEKKLGQLFCDQSSKQILQLLEDECADAQVQIRVNSSITNVERLAAPESSGSPESQDPRWKVSTPQGEFLARSLVVASGGLSFPKLGATPFGYELAQQFGLSVITPRPGLVPLTFGPADLAQFGELSGLSVECLASSHAEAPTFRENLLFTHRGLSGPAILQVSSYWNVGKTVRLNLVPNHSVRDLLESARRGGRELKSVLRPHLPERFIAAWSKSRAPTRPLGQWPQKELEAVAQSLEAWEFKPDGDEGYPKAEVTVGGIATAELSSKTLESRRVPGLHFIGEVVDVTGWLGGYNFQWAWASGYAAGSFV